jgi:Cupredoxin-like domain
MSTRDASRPATWITSAVFAGILAFGFLAQADAVPEQLVEVTIKDFTFVTKQVPLRLNMPVVISIRNEDQVRHDFGSPVFQGIPTQVESDGVISYGRGVEGVFLNPTRDAMIRFTIDRPGRYEFRCSIHSKMKGELLLLSVEAV